MTKIMGDVKIVQGKLFIWAGWLDFKYYSDFEYPVLTSDKEAISLFHRLGEVGIFYPLLSVRFGHAPKKVKNLLSIEMSVIKKMEGGSEIATRTEEGHYSEMTPFTNYVTEMRIGGHNLYKILESIYKKNYPNKRWFIIEITPSYYVRD